MSYDFDAMHESLDQMLQVGAYDPRFDENEDEEAEKEAEEDE